MSRRRKSLLGAAIVLGAAILIPVLRHYQLKAAVERYWAEMKAGGEPMELAQVLPTPVPPEHDSTGMLTNAFALFATNRNVINGNQPQAMRMVAHGKAMVGWRQPDVRAFEATNSWAEIDAALAEDKAALDLLRELPNEADFDFNLNYSAGFGKMKLGPLAQAKGATQKLETSAMVNLHRNEADAAARDIQTMLVLANGLAHDRTLISELVRMAVSQITAATCWEFLQSTNSTDGQLVSLQRSWTDLEFTKPFENSMLMERAVGKVDLNELRRTGLKSYFDMIGTIGLHEQDESFLSSVKVKCKSAMWRYWWSYPDELRHLRGLQAVLDASRQVGSNVSFSAASGELKKQFAHLEISAGDGENDFWFTNPAKADFRSVISSTDNAFESAFGKLLKAEAARRLTITDIALKRFHLKHGRYPVQLAELKPAFLDYVPPDPVDGKPLRYQLNPDGTFLLYSIGEDGVNNGGDARPASGKSFHWQGGRDLVWPQPATPVEIRVWEKEQSNHKEPVSGSTNASSLRTK
jgi:hypothetical protein